MSFGSVLSGIYHAITPWHDSGSVFSSSSYAPKKKPDDTGFSAPTPAPRPVAQQQPQQNKPQTPTSQQISNVFENNKNLMFGQNPNNPIDAAKAQNTTPSLPVKPGTLITPTNSNPRPLDHQAINQGLDAGKSWEQIAKENKLDVNDVKQYSQATRPNYGISNPSSAPTTKPPIPFWKRALNDTGNAASAVGGAALGTLRAGEGAVKGIGDLPAMAVHAATYIPRKIVGDNSTIGDNLNATNMMVDSATHNIVDKPLDWLGKKTDEASQAFGDTGSRVYHPFQVGANIAAVVPAAIEGGSALASKLSGVKDLSEADGAMGVLGKLKNLVDAQKYSPILTALDERLGGNLSKIPFLDKIINTPTELPVSPAVSPTDLPSLPSKAPGAPTTIPVRHNIPVDGPSSTTQPINVRNMTEPKPLIKEFPGDASVQTTDALAKYEADQARIRAADAFNSTARPDQAIEGVTPRPTEGPFKLNPDNVQANQQDIIKSYADQLKSVGEGNGTQLVPNGEGGYTRTSNNFRSTENAGKRMTKQDWIDQAESDLKAGHAEPGHQQAFNDASNPEVQSMLAKGEQAPTPEGRPITVKQSSSIPVRDESTVPTGLDESPNKVTTTNASPANDAAQAVATAPVPKAPAPLPKDTQAVLDNPSQYNKRQVAAARNQRKMANQVAKANEDTAAAMDRIHTASPTGTSPEGFNSTGEFGKSANGGSYEKVGRNAEMKQALTETSQMSPGDVVKTARENQATNGQFNRRDMRNVMAMFESKRVTRGTPEYNELKAILKEDGTHQAQALALRGGNTIRRTATSDQLTSQFESKIYRLADDPTKIDSKAFDAVDAAEQRFTDARDSATAANNRFTESPTHANAKAFHAAADAADAAEKDAKMTEFKVAQAALKGNKDVKQAREIEKMAQGAGLYQMDGIDASMLSGTGTFARNYLNAATGGLEEGLFGKVGAKIASKITGEDVGGGIGRGTLSGLKEGVTNVVDASKARAGEAGLNPFEHIKNYATTGNELGDSIMDSQVKHNVIDHYTQMLKDQGYKGRELTDRASVMARQDPGNVSQTYVDAARTAAGLGGSSISKASKPEMIVRNAISDGMMKFGVPSKVSEPTAKLVTRMTVGFPSAIARSGAEGVRRFTMGVPTFLQAFATEDPLKRAVLIKEGIKQAGTGAGVIAPLFYAMGSKGMITGAYPSDPEKRAEWQREGKTENSIKIGGAYYQLPGYLGSWAVPGLFYASLGANGGDWKAAATDTAKIVPSLLPTDQASNISDVINGRTDFGKFMSQTGAAAVRAATPAGALLNQLSKSLDPTANDTTTGSNWENFISKVEGGIPGINNAANIPTKVDDAGNPISNPTPTQLLFGASAASQDKGVQRTNQLVDQVHTAIKSMGDTGALGDPNLKGILDDKTLQIYNKATSGKDVTQAELKKLQDGLVKGIPSDGSDSAYLEREQYDTNSAALKLKRELMAADKTTKPSELKKLDTNITRSQVYKDNQLPYDMVNSYQKTSLADWRKMGDPEDDAYDPAMYQKLWNIDQLMTKSGVSYNTNDQTSQKFSAKVKKAGRGNGSGGPSTDFGKLSAGNSAPSVQQYQSLDKQAGNIPVIQTVRPNIVHKISSSGGI